MTAGEDVAAALADLARDDVAALLDEVRREGVALARRRLTEAYAEALVRAVVTQHRGTAPAGLSGLCPPAPSSPGSVGCYVYAVVAGDGTGAGSGSRGVEPGGPVGVVTVGDISAVVSDVDIDAMTAGAQAADVDEHGWLAAAVRAHERVVLAAFHSAPTVPMRFGIVHPTRDDVADLLREHADRFRGELRRVEGSAEWSVKVYADADEIAAHVGAVDVESAPEADSDAGRAYLLRQRSRRTVAERTREYVGSCLERVASELGVAARDSIVASLGHDPGDAPVFSASYLVARADEPRFLAVVDAVTSRARSDGLQVQMSGPWPPYHFTTLRLEASRG